MADIELRNAPAGGEAYLPCMNSPDPRPSLKTLIDTLIDIDIEYEREREKLGRSLLDINSNARMLRKLKDQHCERRQPFIQQLIALQKADLT